MDSFENDEQKDRRDRIFGGAAWAALVVAVIFLFCNGGA